MNHATLQCVLLLLCAAATVAQTKHTSGKPTASQTEPLLTTVKFAVPTVQFPVKKIPVFGDFIIKPLSPQEKDDKKRMQERVIWANERRQYLKRYYALQAKQNRQRECTASGCEL